MFVHTVLWNLKKEKNKNDFLKIEELIKSLGKLIPELKYSKMGFNENISSEFERQVILITHFDNEKDYIVYRDHPEHLKVKDEIAKVFENRIVSDVLID